MSTGWLKLTRPGFDLDLDWDVAPGDVLVLFGPSGAGKTTALRAIAGLLRPREGRVTVGRRVVFDSALRVDEPPHRRGIGYVPQDYRLFPHLTVAGNIAFGLAGWSRSDRAGRVAELVDSLRLTDLQQRRPWQLSGGQQQRVALGRALAPRPGLLLLDEPTTALDPALRRAVRRELRLHIDRWRVPVVLVTHDIEATLALGTSVAVLDAGRVIARGEPVAVLGRPPTLEVARLTGMDNRMTATVAQVVAAEGTMRCVVAAVELWVPHSGAAVGEHVDLGVRANEVLIAIDEPRDISAQNIVSCRVVRLDQEPAGVMVTLDCGWPLLALVTPAAVRRLQLRQGDAVWAIVKATSIVVLAPDS